MNTIRFNLIYILILILFTLKMTAQINNDRLTSKIFAATDGGYNFTLRELDSVFTLKPIYVTFKVKHNIIVGLSYYLMGQDSSDILLELELDNKTGKLFTFVGGCINYQDFSQKNIKSIKIFHVRKLSNDELISNKEFMAVVYCK